MLELIVSAVQAVLQVMVIVLFGFVYTKMGFFNMEKQKWLSKLNMVFFTPCLMFTNIASSISLEKLLAFWPIPLFHLVFTLLCYVASQLTTRAVGLGAAYRRFVLACVMFGNTNSLPIAIISSLAVSEAGKILFWNADDTQESVAARGISYTLFFAIFGNLVRWSYGYNLLKRYDDDDEEEQEDEDNNTVGSRTPTYGSVSKGGNSDIERGPIRSGMPSRQLSSSTLTGQPEDTKPVLESSLLLPRLVQNGPDESVPTQSLAVRIAKKVHGFMSPPLYAALLALVVGLTPLKPILFDKHAFLYPCLTKAIETCGRAAVPVILSCLGAQLTHISETQTTSHAARKPVATVILVRFLMMPFLVIPIVVAFVKFGARWSILATDPVFITMMIILGCSPTAINLVQITQVNGLFEEEMLQMLFWSYGVVCVPVCTVLVFVALNIVDKLV